MAIRQVGLAVNCGYARVCIYRNSNPERTGPNARHNIDTAERVESFQSQFSFFTFQEGYFTERNVRKENTSQFDRDSNRVLDAFKSKFLRGGDKESYLDTFSHEKWSELSVAEKKRHSLSNCARCFELHKECQQSFPLKPFYHHKPMVAVDQDAMKSLGAQKFAANLVEQLNEIFQEEASTSFVDALVKNKSSGLEKKLTSKEKRKEKVKIQKEFTKAVNEHYADSAAITMLSLDESKRSYHKKRMAQSFHSPQPAKKPKSHSPNFSNVAWDKEKLRETIENWPSGTPINWSQVAKDHGIPGKNAGQVAKEFTVTQGLDTTHIVTPKRKTTQRPKMRKLPGGVVPIPSNPSVGKIDAQIKDMISEGRFKLGEECAPYTITKYSMVDGLLTPEVKEIKGRKIPLLEIRKQLLDKQLKYMRLTPESTIAEMSRPELIKRLNFECDEKSDEELRELLSQAQKQRYLCMWHDHATILKMGYVMITVHVMYDNLVFLTDDEYEELHPGECANVQAEVEQPELHLLAVGSSSKEDQAALIGDRLSCILDMSEPVKSESGVEVKDTLRFFIGDHPATQFERGTKIGGHYKCAVCGVHESRYTDQAHTLQRKWRTLEELQSVATGGRYGKQPDNPQPFELSVRELRLELEARGFYLHDKVRRPELDEMLTCVLQGVVHVPTLLLPDPTEQLASINLDRYEIMACEPLHDIKGHLINLVNELPHVLPPGETKTQCKHLISQCLKKPKITGADVRELVILLFLQLKDIECSTRILLLLQSIIKIQEIAYSRNDKRCPRQLLQCYNMCWLHMELLKDIFSAPKETTLTKFFGIYVHALTAHIPTQLELACQRSLNAESQERMFGECRGVGEKCSNRQPGNAISQIMIRSQAKQELHMVIGSVQRGDSTVADRAKHLPPLSGTKVKTTFIQRREDSWQAHLQRISPFLVAGEGVWWSKTPSGFAFHDGDTDPDSHDDAFLLMHYRYHSINDVEQRRDVCWKRIVDEKIVISANSIKLYDASGNKTGRLLYRDHSVTFECTSTDPPGTPSASTLDESTLDESIHTTEPSVEVSGRTVPISSDETSDSNESAPSVPSLEHVAGEASSNVTRADQCNKEHEGSETSSASTSEASAVGGSYLTLNLEGQNNGLKTVVANSIKRILGSNSDLVRFDDLRFQLKQAGGKVRHRTAHVSEYKELAKAITAKIKLFKSAKSAQIEVIEKQHYQKSGVLPEKKQGTKYYNLLKERDLASKILRII